MEQQMTVRQLWFAKQLAYAYGHEWALADWEGFDDIPLIPQEIAKIVSEQSTIPGIQSPEMDLHGNVYHTTYSGRLKWVVRQDGSVLVSIYRPDKDNDEGILILSYDSKDEENLKIVRHNPQIEVCDRHLAAIMQPISVISGDDIDTFILLQYIREYGMPA